MKNYKNIGTVDRVARVVAGAALLLLVPLALLGPGYGWALFGLFGVVPLIAGVIGYCPPYALLGINTNRGNARRDAENRYRAPCC